MRNIEVTRGSFGVDVDGRATDDPLHHFQPGLANGEGLVEQVELMPCGPAADVKVGPEPEIGRASCRERVYGLV